MPEHLNRETTIELLPISREPIMSKFVYKVCEYEAWKSAHASGFFAGSADDARDGFIHLSTFSQLPGTLDKHFAGNVNLVLVKIPSASLAPHLKWEASASGSVYPHYYGQLPVAAAQATFRLALDTSGRHVLPGGLE